MSLKPSDNGKWPSTSMGPIRIRHRSHRSLCHPANIILDLWVELVGKPKWLPLNSGYHDVMRTAPIFCNCCSMADLLEVSVAALPNLDQST